MKIRLDLEIDGAIAMKLAMFVALMLL